MPKIIGTCDAHSQYASKFNVNKASAQHLSDAISHLPDAGATTRMRRVFRVGGCGKISDNRYEICSTSCMLHSNWLSFPEKHVIFDGDLAWVYYG
jgi:hypothetical protein